MGIHIFCCDSNSQRHIQMSAEQSSIDKPIISINKPWLEEEEKSEIMNVLNENTLTSAAKDGGKRVRGFESHLRDYLNVKHALAVNSGTSALHAALLAEGIGEGDEVLLPSFTFVATANSVVAAGAKPIFVDVNRHDYTIDIPDLKAKITKNSKAIIPVHLYGHPCDMDEVIETAEKIKMIRNHGMVEGYDTRIFGLNLRLPELSAAIAMIQMNRLSKMLDLRKRNAEALTTLISSFASDSRIALPYASQDKGLNWYLYTIAFEKDNVRDAVLEKMLRDKVGATVYYDPPVHKTPYYERMLASTTASLSGINLANTDWASKHVLSLPIHPLVTPEQLERVAHSIKGAL